MSYVVIARRYRPQRFEDIVGQEHITKTLSNAIKNNRIGQAYIFSGPRGVGKTTTARILAMALNVEDGPRPDPDINSPICQAIIKGKSMDVLEIDGASNRRIEEVRNLRENINYAPSEGRYRVYIIDEVHMLTNEAFNALLKTLEEPPKHAIFVFATTEIHRVPATILSRCQRFDFKRLPINMIMDQLKKICGQEGIKIDDDALLQIAKKADGSMRDGQSILDQIISFSGSDVTLENVEQAIGIINQEVFFRISDLIKSADLKEIVALSRELFSSGLDLTELLLGLEEHIRNFLIVASTKTTDLLDVSEFFAQKYKEKSADFSENDLIAYLNIIGQTISEIKWAQQPFLKFELALIKMAKMPSSQDIESILNKLNLLKKKAPDLNPQALEDDDETTDSFEHIKDIWPKFITKVQETRPIFSSLSDNFTLSSFEENILKIQVKCLKHQQEIVEKNLGLFEKLLAEVSQKSLKINFSFTVVEKKEEKKSENKISKKERQKLFEELKEKNPALQNFSNDLGLEII